MNQISLQDNFLLISPFTEEEVKAAVWQCDGAKSPGPDGYNFNFIKSFWGILKENITTFLAEFQTHDKLVRGSNTSFLTLIPKIASPQNLTHYMSISIIGSMYKILSKLLANRLSNVH